MKPRIMYLENKAQGLAGGEARIGRVTFSRSGQRIYYQGRTFAKIPGGGAKANYYDIATGENYWISGPKKNGEDRLYGERVAVQIDEDVTAEYWTMIRGRPLDLKLEVVPGNWTGRIVKSKPEIRSRECPRNDVSIALNSKRELRWRP